MFGKRRNPSLEDVWQTFSQEVGGEFFQAKFWTGQGCKVRIPHSPWTITLETGWSDQEDDEVTRLRTPFFNQQKFEFTVQKRVMLNEIGKLLGNFTDISIGDPEFDETFLVLSKDARQVCELLSPPGIHRLLLAAPQTRLIILQVGGLFAPKYPPEVYELQVQAKGKISHIERLRQMRDLFVATLDRMCDIGITQRQTPVPAI